MRKMYLLMVVCTFLGSGLLAQANKSLMKSFALDGASSISIELKGIVEVKEWDNSIVRVISNVEVSNFNETYLKRLIAAGRYNLSATAKSDGVLVINAPKMARKVVISGQALDESVKYTVFVPRGVSVNLIDSVESSIN